MNQAASNSAPSAKEALVNFEEYLIAVCGFSPRTVDTYKRQISKLFLHVADDYAVVDENGLRGVIQVIHKKKKMSARTQHLMVSAWRKFFDFLKKRNIRTDNPATHLETPKVKKPLPKWVPEEEMRRLLTACNGVFPEERRMKAIVYLLYASGMRVSELTALRMADWAGREDGFLMVQGKGGKHRLVPLGKEAEDALDIYIADGRQELNPQGSDYIFPSKQYKTKPLTRQRMFQIIQEVAEPLGVEMSPHKFRHSCATHMLTHGADLASIQTLLGHSQLQTTEVYTDVLDETLRKAMEEDHPLASKK